MNLTRKNLTETKQVQIEDFIRFNDIDVLHLQESEICDETFSKCNFICSNFDIYSNNAENKYGTSSLVKNIFPVENVRCDTRFFFIRINIFQPSLKPFLNFWVFQPENIAIPKPSSKHKAKLGKALLSVDPLPAWHLPSFVTTKGSQARPRASKPSRDSTFGIQEALGS